MMRKAWLMTVLIGACSGSAAPDAPATTRANEPAPATQEVRHETRIEPPSVLLEPVGRDPVRVVVEVAATNQQRMRGLMYRERLAPDAGMLFLFDRPKHQVFWMRNTYLPLDMIFITADHRVLGVVENATPRTDDPRGVDGDSQYVLEVNAGFARANGIGPGTRVAFERVSATPQSEEEL
jgi:uncharacterized membrane protein (UPF0127 family)